MSEAKDMIIKHHKLGDIKMGKIPNNEKCRMIVQLLQQQQKMGNDLRGASMLIAKIPEKTRNKYIEEIKKEMDEAQAKLVSKAALDKAEKDVKSSTQDKPNTSK